MVQSETIHKSAITPCSVNNNIASFQSNWMDSLYFSGRENASDSLQDLIAMVHTTSPVAVLNTMKTHGPVGMPNFRLIAWFTASAWTVTAFSRINFTTSFISSRHLY